MSLPTAEVAFEAWHEDVKDLYGEQEQFMRPDHELPLVALIGLYALSHEAQPAPTVYGFTKTVASSPLTVAAVSTVMEVSSPFIADSFEDTSMTRLPDFDGPSNLYAHYKKALRDGMPLDEQTISMRELALVEVVGHASYDHVVSYGPLRIARDCIQLLSHYTHSHVLIVEHM